jgi:hypothetical protein
MVESLELSSGKCLQYAVGKKEVGLQRLSKELFVHVNTTLFCHAAPHRNPESLG